jgi:hypothetical protein
VLRVLFRSDLCFGCLNIGRVGGVVDERRLVAGLFEAHQIGAHFCTRHGSVAGLREGEGRNERAGAEDERNDEVFHDDTPSG